MATTEMNDDGTPKEPVKPTEELTAEQIAASAADAGKQIDDKPVPEPVVEPVLTEEDLDLAAAPVKDEVTFEPTGNATLDTVGKLLASKEVDPAILKTFTETGEFSLEEKAAIIDGLGEATASLVFDKLDTEVKNVREANTKARSETLAYAATAFEGASADTVWEQIKTYVANPENGFEPEVKADLTSMLKQGGLKAKMALDYIAKQYYSNPNTTSPADLVAGDTYVSGQFEGITAKAYATEVKKAINEHGESSPQVQDLRRRRDLSRQQGI